MNAYHENFFVVAAIEYADTATLRQSHRRTPQKIMIQLEIGGSAEAVHLAAGGA